MIYNNCSLAVFVKDCEYTLRVETIAKKKLSRGKKSNNLRHVRNVRIVRFFKFISLKNLRMTKHGKKWPNSQKVLLLGRPPINSTLFLTMSITQAREYIKVNKQK